MKLQNTYRAEYRPDTNTATFYIGAYVVATLEFDTDLFEQHEEQTEAESEYFYNQMVQEKINYEHQNSQILTISDYK